MLDNRLMSQGNRLSPLLTKDTFQFKAGIYKIHNIFTSWLLQVAVGILEWTSGTGLGLRVFVRSRWCLDVGCILLYNNKIMEQHLSLLSYQKTKGLQVRHFDLISLYVHTINSRITLQQQTETTARKSISLCTQLHVIYSFSYKVLLFVDSKNPILCV